jgi:hypothetical protein
MAALPTLPADYRQSRQDLQLVATHVLARARFLATGRFGLRVTWDGFGTPAFGPRNQVLRISGDLLIQEQQDEQGTLTRTLSMADRSLEELAEFAGVDLSAPFSPGADAPALGSASGQLELSSDAVGAVLAWFRLGAEGFDRVLHRLAAPSIMQLWPEHFDVGFDAATAIGRVNFGASPGDVDHPEPYLYIGPWNEQRPGDPTFWNAPFGARLGHAGLRRAADPLEAAVAFLRTGIDALG